MTRLATWLRGFLPPKTPVSEFIYLAGRTAWVADNQLWIGGSDPRPLPPDSSVEIRFDLGHVRLTRYR